jgi:hypothetical protein
MTKNVHQRMAEVMAAVTYIQKERKPGMNYTIVSHDAVTAKVRPALLEAGVIYYPINVQSTQDGNRTQVHMTVRFANIDQPSDFIDVQSIGYGIDSQDKGPGKATSYAVKYALLKALGLETGDDPDHDNIEHEPGPTAEQTFEKLATAAFRMAATVEEIDKCWKDNAAQMQSLELTKTHPTYIRLLNVFKECKSKLASNEKEAA